MKNRDGEEEEKKLLNLKNKKKKLTMPAACGEPSPPAPPPFIELLFPQCSQGYCTNVILHMDVWIAQLEAKGIQV